MAGYRIKRGCNHLTGIGDRNSRPLCSIIYSQYPAQKLQFGCKDRSSSSKKETKEPYSSNVKGTHLICKPFLAGVKALPLDNTLGEAHAELAWTRIAIMAGAGLR